MITTSLIFLTAAFVMYPGPLSACHQDVHILNPGHIKVTHYKPKQNTTKAVIILPPTGGRTFLDGQYARSLCHEGMAALLIEDWDGLAEQSVELDVHQRLLTRGQSAISTVLDTFKFSSFGILGTSVGAIHAATAFGQNPKLISAFLIAGGGPIHQVIAESGEENLKKSRQARLKKFGFKDVNEYAKALAEHIGPELESIHYAGYIQEKRLQMVVADSDETVQTKFQNIWVEEFKPEQVYRLDAGHMWTIIKAWWFYEKDMVDFFKSSL